MNYDEAREKRIDIFNDTMELCMKNSRLSESVNATRKGTVYYAPDAHPKFSPKGSDTEINVTSERTFEAAKRLSQKHRGKKIAVLNFASATNPGGGVKRGSSAQEEALCRTSTLYPCINTDELFGKYYKPHRNKGDVRYTDACIYTPDITVFKSDTSFPEVLPENQWFCTDVITCAAPNLREKPYNPMNPGKGTAIRLSDSELLSLHKKRGKHILEIAAANGADVIVLGAFGCGAFRNDPNVVAKAYSELLEDFKGSFDEIVFAVYCAPNDTKNFEIFKKNLIE
ncbi:MAG: TIGR02452 family protein [Oscillospiraceae bacterium]|nr:TIGR02452 family protein [Oscillospiraceae bacterium]